MVESIGHGERSRTAEKTKGEKAMLMYEMHYYRNGKPCFKYIYSNSRQEAEAKARAYKTFFKLVFIGYR